MNEKARQSVRSIAIVLAGTVVLANVPGIHEKTALLGVTPANYNYVSSDGRYSNVEWPLKGRGFGVVEHQFDRSREGANDQNVTLCRTFSRQWWRVWCWYDYATNPRWRCPYRAPDAV